jgi:hypothetical protein
MHFVIGPIASAVRPSGQGDQFSTKTLSHTKSRFIPRYDLPSYSVCKCSNLNVLKLLFGGMNVFNTFMQALFF